VSQDTQRFAFVLLLLSSGHIRLAGLVPAQEQSGRVRKGPFEVSVTHLVPRSAHAFAPGVFRALDESTRRSEILHTWEALDLVHCVEQDETKELAHARHGWE
jgi:hypothetical protein